ncbi:MAG: 2Fe-2S iron-sulfur cluster-binding protein [Treponema sp.]|nr:2Fe-2S iron-sulfur cluster-binding protein [Treponema sp.]
MNISVIFNGNKTIIDAPSDESLLSVLRKMSCTSVKCGCSQGLCGSCAVLLDDKPVVSCKIPVGIINNANIVTLDYLESSDETANIYKTIMQGFGLADIKLCGYCNAGKIFSAYKLLKMNKVPSREEITEEVKHLAPCCIDLNTLVNGIIYATEIRDKGYEQVARMVHKKHR